MSITDYRVGLVSIGSDNSATKLPDFTALSTQIAKVSPTGVLSASYNPTNTIARDCPATGVSWDAATPLPPTPNEQLCSCMVQNLTCVAKSSVSTDAIPILFGNACDPRNGANICDGITHNGTTGSYGAYSGCNATDQLSWAFNAYYQQQLSSNSANTDACDFGGNATTQSPSTPSGVCASLVNQAGGVAGTGTVTSQPSGTGAAGGSGSGSGSASSSKGAAGTVTVPSLNFGVLSWAVYVTAAALTGAGMILL